MSNDTVGPFRVEVIADSSGEFCGNMLQFPTREAARAYAIDLWGRWTAVRSWRIVEHIYAGWLTIKAVVEKS